MRILSKRNVLHRGILLYRRLRHRRGHGVHSPFVFRLITRVIEEKNAYYFYAAMDLLRKKFAHDANGSLFRHEALNPKKGRLLFRLANYFHPATVLHIGSSIDTGALYMSGYAKGVKTYALDSNPAFAPLARQLYEQGARNAVGLRIGVYQDELPRLLATMPSVDFVFFNVPHEQNPPIDLFTACKKYANGQTVFVWNEIKTNASMRACWRAVCADPEVTVTVDLYSLGIAFVNPKLHKRNYKVYLK